MNFASRPWKGGVELHLSRDQMNILTEIIHTISSLRDKARTDGSLLRKIKWLNKSMQSCFIILLLYIFKWGTDENFQD